MALSLGTNNFITRTNHLTFIQVSNLLENSFHPKEKTTEIRATSPPHTARKSLKQTSPFYQKPSFCSPTNDRFIASSQQIANVPVVGVKQVSQSVTLTIPCQTH